MSLKGIVAAMLALYWFYLLSAGSTVVAGWGHYISQTEAAMCTGGFLGRLTRKQANTCSALFTSPSGLVKRTTSGDALFVDHQVSRGDMKRLHLVVLSTSPESMVSAVSFDEWWSRLPIEGS